MPTFITRLDLSNGKSLQVGKQWPGDESATGQFKVALIIERAEEATQDEDGSILTAPAHYEIWLLPDQLREALFAFYGEVYAGRKPTSDAIRNEINKVPNVPCRRVYLNGQIEFVEEVWNMLEAYPEIHKFFEDKLELEQTEETPPPARAQLSSPIARPNGPQAG